VTRLVITHNSQELRRDTPMCIYNKDSFLIKVIFNGCHNLIHPPQIIKFHPENQAMEKLINDNKVVYSKLSHILRSFILILEKCHYRSEVNCIINIHIIIRITQEERKQVCL
jgi:hypothetical protein